jgi:hypothetical protein
MNSTALRISKQAQKCSKHPPMSISVFQAKAYERLSGAASTDLSCPLLAILSFSALKAENALSIDLQFMRKGDILKGVPENPGAAGQKL